MTFRFVPKIEAALRVVTLVCTRFEADVTFRFVPKIEVALRVVTLVCARLDTAVTFRFVPKIEAALRVVTLVCAKFDRPDTLRKVRVPRLCIFSWDDAVTEIAVGTVETFEPFKFEIAEPFEIIIESRVFDQ